MLALLLAKALLDFPEAQRFVRRTALTAASLGLLAALASPFVAPFFISANLVRQAGRDVTAEMEFAASEYREPSLVWYFRKHTKRWLIDIPEFEVKPFMELPGARFVVLHTDLARSLYPVDPRRLENLLGPRRERHRRQTARCHLAPQAILRRHRCSTRKQGRAVAHRDRSVTHLRT